MTAQTHLTSDRHLRLRLTERRAEQASVPASGERQLHDESAPGLSLRIRASGGKSWRFTYRTAGGRAGKVRRITLGSFPSMSLADARREAALLRGRVAAGLDPVAELKQKRDEDEKASQKLHLANAINLYGEALSRRQVKDRANVVSALRRRLLGENKQAHPDSLGNILLEDITRADVSRIVATIEAADQPGAARSLRQKTTTFLNWAVDEGHLAYNPLQGMRRRRQTRAERTAQRGRMLSDAELGILWSVCSDLSSNKSLGLRTLSSLVQILILTGQRRTETSRIRRTSIDFEAGWWTIPPDDAKNGVAHSVPLTDQAMSIIQSQPFFSHCEWAFSTNGRTPVSGWSKLEPKLRLAASKKGLTEPWTLHDLRRTFRSGLTRLGVDQELAEIMINHRPERMRAIYDLEPRLEERKKASHKWASHIAQL